ncbi:MAG: DUF29 domain-containing protein [Cyanobacteria bacterium]|nr:DUF29 domain-containing protein [Cyanobacteriota bacterium]
MSDYEADFYAWTQQQGAILREWRPPQLDWENLAEEIESMGRQERRELVNRLAVLLGHLLKWRYQPELRGKSWRTTIQEQRRQVARLMKQNPSLKSYLPEAFLEGYGDGRLLAIRETALDEEDFPIDPPFDLDWALTADLEG